LKDKMLLVKKWKIARHFCTWSPGYSTFEPVLLG
jgi:hypothetical protein